MTPSLPSHTIPGEAEPAIRDCLDRAKRIWKLSECARRGLTLLAAGLFSLLALAWLDNALALPSLLRAVLLWTWLLGGAGALCFWVLPPAVWRIGDQSAAVYLERKIGERENLLINAVQLQTRAPAGASANMVSAVLAQAANRAFSANLDALWSASRLRRLGWTLGAVLAAAAGYAFVCPAHALNACQRLFRPGDDIPPLASTRIWIQPVGEIEVTAGDLVVVYALVAGDPGAPPPDAALVVEFAGETRRFPMRPSESVPLALLDRAGNKDARGYEHELSGVENDLTIRVAAGDGVSRTCRVSVRRRPEITQQDTEITPPAYTGWPVVHERSPGGSVHALPGSKIKMLFTVNEELRVAALRTPGETIALERSEGNVWSGWFAAAREGQYAIKLSSAAGAVADPALLGKIFLRADALPAVYFENAELNVPALIGATIPLSVRATDDIGLKSLRFLLRSQGEEEGAEVEWAARRFDAPGKQEVREPYPLHLDAARFAPGGVYAVTAEVSDWAPGPGRARRSAPLVIRLLSQDQMRMSVAPELLSVFDRIQELIELQTKARGKAITLRDFEEDLRRKNVLKRKARDVWDDQFLIRARTGKLEAEIPRDAKGRETIPEALSKLRQGPMTQVIARLQAAQDKKTTGTLRPELESVISLQRDILDGLLSLLGSTVRTENAPPPPVADLKDDQDASRLRDKLAEAHDKVKEFIREQEKIVKTTEEFEKKKPDDLTEEDKKTLGDLAAEEQDWAKYFKDLHSDLSKVPEQDFSNSKLAEEFNEVFQEIQKASEELQNKNVEIAVRNEEAGLEMAKELESNLERWLPDTRDTQKWNMEEPKGEFDVPLADLPLELEDIIGELIDDEDKMTEEVEDVSSSWMDSLDKGAGWGAMDGNISNMSAKGVTGNRLPNEHEVGGRSGEGRSGRSQGQFVEETADGKGGRQTPSRTTPDPYEEGQVKDSSQDALGGATGGGKDSGEAGLGLRGTPPPQTHEQLQRLRGMQADLRQRAEKIDTQLRAYHLPSADMEEAVRRMKAVEANLQSGKGFDLRQAHSQVIDALANSQKAVGYQAQINQERNRSLPKHVRQEILSGIQEGAPEGYRDLLEAYYKSLVEKDR